jgi:hypothetical protein
MAYVTTTISGDRVPPEYWTSYFGVVPTFRVEKGVQFVTPAGKRSVGIGKSNIWGYSTTRECGVLGYFLAARDVRS